MSYKLDWRNGLAIGHEDTVLSARPASAKTSGGPDHAPSSTSDASRPSVTAQRGADGASVKENATETQDGMDTRSASLNASAAISSVYKAFEAEGQHLDMRFSVSVSVALIHGRGEGETRSA